MYVVLYDVGVVCVSCLAPVDVASETGSAILWYVLICFVALRLFSSLLWSLCLGVPFLHLDSSLT